MAEAWLGLPIFLPGVSAARMTGANRWCGAIVLEVFGWVGLVVSELRNFDIVGVGK